MRILAIDVGEKTAGVAISDETALVASPRTTLRRDGTEVEKLRSIVAAEEIAEVVVGLPLSLNGTMGPSAQMAMEFAEQLRRALEVPIVTWDERLTTVQAERCLIEGNVRRKKRRTVIDQVAATLILQGYLDSRRSRSLHDEDPSSLF